MESLPYQDHVPVKKIELRNLLKAYKPDRGQASNESNSPPLGDNLLFEGHQSDYLTPEKKALEHVSPLMFQRKPKVFLIQGPFQTLKETFHLESVKISFYSLPS